MKFSRVVLESIHVSFANGRCVESGEGRRWGVTNRLLISRRVQCDLTIVFSEFIHAKIILRGIFFFALKVIIDNSRRGYPLVTDNPQEWKLPIIILSLSIDKRNNSNGVVYRFNFHFERSKK